MHTVVPIRDAAFDLVVGNPAGRLLKQELAVPADMPLVSMHAIVYVCIYAFMHACVHAYIQARMG